MPQGHGQQQEEQGQKEEQQQQQERKTWRACDLNQKYKGYTPQMFVDVQERSAPSGGAESPDTANTSSCLPLRVAITINRVDIVECMLGKGYAVNAMDDDGCTPLVLAVGMGFVAVAKVLLVAGADDTFVAKRAI